MSCLVTLSGLASYSRGNPVLWGQYLRKSSSLGVWRPPEPWSGIKWHARRPLHRPPSSTRRVRDTRAGEAKSTWSSRFERENKGKSRNSHVGHQKQSGIVLPSRSVVIMVGSSASVPSPQRCLIIGGLSLLAESICTHARIAHIFDSPPPLAASSCRPGSCRSRRVQTARTPHPSWLLSPKTRDSRQLHIQSERRA